MCMCLSYVCVTVCVCVMCICLACVFASDVHLPTPSLKKKSICDDDDLLSPHLNRDLSPKEGLQPHPAAAAAIGWAQIP